MMFHVAGSAEFLAHSWAELLRLAARVVGRSSIFQNPVFYYNTHKHPALFFAIHIIQIFMKVSAAWRA